MFSGLFFVPFWCHFRANTLDVWFSQILLTTVKLTFFCMSLLECTWFKSYKIELQRIKHWAQTCDQFTYLHLTVLIVYGFQHLIILSPFLPAILWIFICIHLNSTQSSSSHCAFSLFFPPVSCLCSALQRSPGRCVLELFGNTARLSAKWIHQWGSLYTRWNALLAKINFYFVENVFIFWFIYLFVYHWFIYFFLYLFIY